MRLTKITSWKVWVAIGLLFFWLTSNGISQSAAIGDIDGDGVSDAIEQANSRDVALSLTQDEIVVTSTLLGGSNGDQIQYRIRPSSVGWNLTLNYKSAANGSTWDLVRWVEVRSLIEYEDGDGLAGFNGAADFVRNQIAFSSIWWKEVHQTDGVSQIVFRDTSGHVTVTLLAGKEFIHPASSPLVTPTQIRIGVAIENYPFVQAGNFLALHVAFDSGIPTPNITALS